MVISRACCMLLAAACLAQLAPAVQATRPGPMLRGGTILLLQRPQRSAFVQPQGFSGDSFNAIFDEDTLDRMFDGPSVFGPPLHLLGQPRGGFMELLGPPRRPCPLAAAREHDAMMRHMAAARFGPGALASLLAAAAELERGEDASAQQWALEQPIYTIDPASKAAAQHPLAADSEPWKQEHTQEHAQHMDLRWKEPSVQAGFSVSPGAAAALTADDSHVIEDAAAERGLRVIVDTASDPPMVTVAGDDAAAVQAAANEIATAAGAAHRFGRQHEAAAAAAAERGARSLHAGAAAASRFSSAFASGFGQVVDYAKLARDSPLAAPADSRWRFRDFVARSGGSASTGAVTAADSQQSEPFEGLGWPTFERAFGFGDARVRELVHPVQAHAWRKAHPQFSWDLFQDGQLNGGVLVFLLLCIACAAVWSRLLVLWCSFRSTTASAASCIRRRRSRNLDQVANGLEAPLLNPLHHEAPLKGEPFRVEVAAKHPVPAPAAGYVTLQYVPLREE